MSRAWYLLAALPLVGSLALGAHAHAASPPPVSEVVAKMQAFYNGAKDLKGKFKQVYTDSLYARQKTSYGYLYVKKPGMMRWNYVKPEQQSFIADGKTLWVWEPAAKQAFRNPLTTQTLSTGLTFLMGKGNLASDFRVAYAETRLGGPGDLVLKLTPKTPTGQYDHLLFVVNPTDHSVGESMVVSKHNTNHFVFSKLEVNTRVQTSRFKFYPPPGTRVIDASKLQRSP